MDELARTMERHGDLMVWLSLGSIAMLVCSALLVPFLVVRAPADVFVREISPTRGPVGVAAAVVRNVLAGFLFVAGVFMLVLPGQGVLTLVAALCLADVPRKRILLRRVVLRPRVWRALEWMRLRAGRPPFERP